MRLFKGGVAVCAGAGILVLFFSCIPSIENASQVLPPNRAFYATNLTGEGPRRYQINATLVAQGEHCIVYLDEADTYATTEKINNLVWEFDTRIYDGITSAFGTPLIDDAEKRIILLLMDIQDGAESTGGSYVSGYFYPNDLLHTTQSNLTTMLYIDTNPGFFSPSGVFSTTAHELQHLISYSARLHAGKTGLETWIDEGLSTGAEFLYLNAQQLGRVRYFNEGNNQIRNGNSFYIWGNRDDLLADYSSTYMFFQWLRIQSSNKHHIYREIIESPVSDYRAVTRAARLRMPDIFSDPNDEGDAWTQLFGAWLCANAIDASDGIYGYGGEITGLQPRSPTTTDVMLAPGEAVYYAPGDSILQNSGSLRHVAISRLTGHAYFELSNSDYRILKNDGLISAILTYNCNTDKKGPNIPFTVSTPLPQPAQSLAASPPENEEDAPSGKPVFSPVDARAWPFWE